MSAAPSYDAIIIGSGPNGLAAAIALAQAQLSVLVFESAPTIGGGTRSAELTQPGFVHDVCSAVHPMGALSPFFNQLPLADHGLEWIFPPVSVAHPLDDGPAILLRRSLDETSAGLGRDAKVWRQLMTPFLRRPEVLIADVLAPLGLPQAPLIMARLGFYGLPSVRHFARRFSEPRAKALFAGCAGHSILPLDRMLSAAVGLVFSITGHLVDWPIARGGSAAIAQALASYLRSLGGKIETNCPIAALDDLPQARAVLFDTSPRQIIDIAAKQLPAAYLKRLSGYRYGPGTFKVNWALDGPIPWRDPQCALASTVHIGGTLEEIAAAEAAPWKGEIHQRPYLILCQQSNFDPSRAPKGKHTGYAYCHVPNGCDLDMTTAIEAQIERFAPGFGDLILDRYRQAPGNFAAYNNNYVGGAITGGVADLGQLFTRPVARLNPYTTPNPRIFICSASTPPGGGVHGMCGFYAAQAVLKQLKVSVH